MTAQRVDQIADRLLAELEARRHERATAAAVLAESVRAERSAEAAYFAFVDGRKP